jgi:hypothetical protein
MEFQNTSRSKMKVLLKEIADPAHEEGTGENEVLIVQGHKRL